MSFSKMGYGIGYILGSLYHLGPPDYTPDYEKYAIKQQNKEKIFNKRMESLYGKEVWKMIRDKRIKGNMDRMFGK